MDRGGPREEGGRGRREEEKTGETRVENWRDEARREGQNEANGVNLPGCRGSPSPPWPPRAPCSFSFLSFCYVEPAAFPAIRSIRPLSLLFPRSSCRRSRGDASSMRPTPATRCRLILFLSFSPCTGEKTKPRDPVAGVSFSISSNIFPRLLALI